MLFINVTISSYFIDHILHIINIKLYEAQKEMYHRNIVENLKRMYLNKHIIKLKVKNNSKFEVLDFYEVLILKR